MSDSKVRIGVVGAGRWGPNLIRNFHLNSRSLVAAVADRNPERLALIRERHGAGVALIEDVDELIADESIDAVVICTPTETHYEFARKTLEAGKHVFVEKPLARTSEECQHLIELARLKGLVLFVGHVFVYNPAIRAVGKLIAQGWFGKIFHMQVTRTNLGPVRGDVSALWDLAPHDLSILQYWLGEMPKTVSAVGGCYLNAGIEDTVFATYRFRDGLLANVHVSWLNPKKEREITIVGEKMMLDWDDMSIERPVRIYDKSVSFFPDIKVGEPLKAECEAFLNALGDPKTSLSSGEHGKLVVDALVATERSIKDHGREVVITL